MLTFLKNVFKKGELRRKVIFTLGILFVYRLGAGITIPGVDVGSLNSSDATNGIFGIMNLLGGGTLERFSLFALGVSPYITSSIIIELLSMDVIPALTRWRKEGNTGKKKKDRVTRVLTLLLAALQGGVLTNSVFIRHYPIVERLLDFVLAFTRKNGFLCVKYPFSSAVWKLPVIIHDCAFLVQKKLRQLVCVQPFCAVGFSRKHVRHSA